MSTRTAAHFPTRKNFYFLFQLRKAVCAHIETRGSPLLHSEYDDGRSYVKLTKMRFIGTWGGDIEVQAICDMLDCAVYVYGGEAAPVFCDAAPMPVDFQPDMWVLCVLQNWLDSVAVAQGDKRAIYFRIRGSHYEPRWWRWSRNRWLIL